MKIGTETASLSNHLYSRAVIGQPEPEVGMGVTFLGWTDRNPGTIVEVFKIGASVAIACTNDDYKRTDSNGMSECQSYEYTSRPDGHRSHFKRRPDGKWQAVERNPDTKRWNNTSGGLRIGGREKYHDFNF